MRPIRLLMTCVPVLGCGQADFDDSQPGATSSVSVGDATRSNPGEGGSDSPGTGTGAGATGATDSTTSSGGASTGDGDAGSTGLTTGGSTGGAADEIPPTEAGALLAWLESGVYLEWPAESGVHASTGPHFGGVRTFINVHLHDGLAAGLAEHPVGASAVKELYGDGVEVRGWAVAVKTDPGTSGDTWYWYEIYDGSVLADAQGLGLCVNCHSAGADHVLTPYPLQ